MSELALIASTLSSIKTATDLAKLIKASDVSLEKAETKLKLADLISSLADARIQLAEIKEMILEKDEIIRELTEQQKIKSKIKFEEPYYYLLVETGQDGPFCQCCYDKDSKLIRLTLEKCLRGTFHCKVCDSWYGEGHVNM